jgi:hypothetical protein
MAWLCCSIAFQSPCLDSGQTVMNRPAADVDVGEFGLDAEREPAGRALLALKASVEDGLTQIGPAVRVDAVHELERDARCAGRARQFDGLEDGHRRLLRSSSLLSHSTAGFRGLSLPL